MKKRIFSTVTAVISMFVFIACGNEASQNNVSLKNETIEEMNTDENVIQTSEENTTMGTDTKEDLDNNRIKSILEEMAEIESKSLEYENGNWNIPQQEMNALSGEWYTLWDEELNILWGQLNMTLSENEMSGILEEQMAWMKRKEQNMIAAGYDAYGGTLQPLLESSVAKDMTRARSYILAEYLADAYGENYTIPTDIKDSFADVDPSLDSVFESFRESGTLDGDVDFNINTIEESPFSDNFEEGIKWIFWYFNSDVLTDSDVYAFTNNRIIFEKDGIYYVLERGRDDNRIIISTGTDLLYMDVVGN